jgi:hypothetical protein
LAAALSISAAAVGCSKTDKTTRSKKSTKVPELAEVASPLDTGVTSNSRQRFVNLLRYRLNLPVARQEEKWDLWAEGSGKFVLPDGRKTFLLSFRRTVQNTRQEGLMVMGRMEGDMPSVLAQWRLDASIDDMHVVDFGPPAGSLIHTVSMGPKGKFRMLHHHLLRLRKGKLEVTWSVKGGYFASEPKTYQQPVIRFSDVDKNGVREVLVRLPQKKKPGKRRRRWAVFRWDSYAGRFVPSKNLAWTPLAFQDPAWAVFGFVEAVTAADQEAAQGFVKYGGTPCQHPDDLIFAFDPKRWKRSGLPSAVTPKKRQMGPNRTLVRVPLKEPGGPKRFEARVELVAGRAPLPTWKICRATFLKY